MTNARSRIIFIITSERPVKRCWKRWRTSERADPLSTWGIEQGSPQRLMAFGRRQPAGANPGRLRFVEDHALHTAVHDAVSVMPIGVAHPDRRLVRLVIVDENRLLA